MLREARENVEIINKLWLECLMESGSQIRRHGDCRQSAQSVGRCRDLETHPTATWAGTGGAGSARRRGKRGEYPLQMVAESTLAGTIEGCVNTRLVSRMVDGTCGWYQLGTVVQRGRSARY